MTRLLPLICITLLLAQPAFAQEKKADTGKSASTEKAQDKKTTDEEKKEKMPAIKTRVFKIEKKEGGKVVSTLPLNIPVTWKQKPNKTNLRAATFEIPKVKGEQEPGELTAFIFTAQAIDLNVQRWIKQFQSKGRKQKLVKGRATKRKFDYYMVELSGTYKKPDGPPFMQKTIDAPGYRMIGLIVPMDRKNVCFLKLTGPDKTVAAQVEAMRKSIDGVKKTEKPYSKS